MKNIRMRRVSLSAAIVLALVIAMAAVAGCACSSTAANSSASSSSSTAAATLTVPNVVSLTQQDAEKSIVAAGLEVGDVTREASDTVPEGNVISQSPKALAQAKEGDQVDMVVSSGKKAAAEVKVPDLKGKTQDEAKKALADVNLVGVASNPEESTEVAPGLVFKQSIAAGTTVKEGEKVAFTVAYAPEELTVPNVVGKTRDDAKKAITDAKFGFDYTVSYSDEVAEGLVISQSVAAGSKAKSGSTVSVVVSLGSKPAEDVQVPDVTSQSWQSAEATLKSAGLKARYTGNPSGYVVAQDVAAGTLVAPGTLVTVTLENPDPGQNPVMGFIGNYGAERANILVEADGDSDAKITVEWPSSAAESSVWTMSGTFDAKTLSVKYTDGKRVDYTYDDSGKVTDENTVYTDGTGTFTFKDATKLVVTWKDDKEHVADDMTFEFGA